MARSGISQCDKAWRVAACRRHSVESGSGKVKEDVTRLGKERVLPQTEHRRCRHIRFLRDRTATKPFPPLNSWNLRNMLRPGQLKLTVGLALIHAG